MRARFGVEQDGWVTKGLKVPHAISLWKAVGGGRGS